MNAATLLPIPRGALPAAGSEAETLASDALPPVRVLLASLLWLAAKQHESPAPTTQRAIAVQLQRLAIHPDASAEDRLAGLRLGCRSYHDALLWLGDCGDAAH